MKIMICGSMTNARQMMDLVEKLEEYGHAVFLPPDIQLHSENPKFIDDLDANLKYALKNDIMMKAFNLINKSDGMLVANHRKNNINGYIGASVLMEIAIAYYLRKRIFLLNELPSIKKARWAVEVKLMRPVILNGDLTKIK